MPTFICEELYSQCNVANVGDARAQDECKTNIQDQCGSLTPPSRGSNDDDDDDDDSTSTSASATSSPTSTSGSDDAEETGDDDSFAAAGAAPRIAMAAGAGLLAYLI